MLKSQLIDNWDYEPIPIDDELEPDDAEHGAEEDE